MLPTAREFRRYSTSNENGEDYIGNLRSSIPHRVKQVTLFTGP